MAKRPHTSMEKVVLQEDGFISTVASGVVGFRSTVKNCFPFQAYFGKVDFPESSNRSRYTEVVPDSGKLFQIR